MSKNRQRVMEQLSYLKEATFIAEESMSKLATNDEDFRRSFREFILDMRKSCIQREQRFMNMASVNMAINDFLVYYNEGGGPDVEEFWRRVQEAGLPFERKDVLRIVLNRDRVRTRSEYDIVIDTAIPASQTGRITEEQCSRLLQLAENYEQRACKRRR